jgi:hypothetical protein
MYQPNTSKNYAWLLYTIAVEFHEAYLAIERDTLKRHDFIGMRHYLLCHAMELILKSWLVDTGQFNEDKLVSRVKQVYGSSKELDACAVFASILNPDYKSKGYEYPINNGRFRGTECDKFGAVLGVLIPSVAKSIRANTYPEVPLP